MVVGMDIGYGDGVSYGGSKYVLVLVDQCTITPLYMACKALWVLTFVNHYEPLWKFSIDAGGFPETIQCDFDP